MVFVSVGQWCNSCILKMKREVLHYNTLIQLHSQMVQCLTHLHNNQMSLWYSSRSMSSLMQCYIQSLFIIARHIAVSSSDRASSEHRQAVMTVVSCNWGLATLVWTAFQRKTKNCHWETHELIARKAYVFANTTQNRRQSFEVSHLAMKSWHCSLVAATLRPIPFCVPRCDCLQLSDLSSHPFSQVLHYRLQKHKQEQPYMGFNLCHELHTRVTWLSFLIRLLSQQEISSLASK